MTTSLEEITDNARENIEKQPLLWAAVALALVGGVIVTQRVLATPDSGRARARREIKRRLADLDDIGSSVLKSGKHGKRVAARELESVADTIRTELASLQKSGVTEKISNHDRALAAFSATLLAKGASSYFKWRSMEKARAQASKAEATSGSATERAKDTDSAEDLYEFTVAELRTVASEQEIEGRSSMNKDELVAALLRNRTSE